MKYLRLIFLAVCIIFQVKSVLAQPKPDLIISQIERPIWQDSTRVFIQIKNIGSVASSPVTLKVWDIDVSVEEAKKLGASKKQLWIFEENTERASDGKFDYDKYFEIFKEIPAIKPHKTIRVEINVKDWIYNSNCEIGVFIDCNEILNEKRADNNKSYFFEGG